MGLLPLLLLFLLLAPALLFIFYFNLAAISFTKLGLTPPGAVLLFGLSLLGSVVNIPLFRQRFVVEEGPPFWFPFLFYYPPRVREQVIAVNLGGAIIPSSFAVYLLLSGRAPLLPALIATVVVALIARSLARVVPGVGITLPAFIPPLVAASIAFLLTRDNAAAVAYLSGSLGTLVGADILNLPRIGRLGSHVVSIGGAGVYDGIFLAGVVAALLA